MFGEILRLCPDLDFDKKFAKEMYSHKENEIVLFENSKTDYVIIIPDSAGEKIRDAAMDMKKILEEMSGAEFPLFTDEKEVHTHEIVIGETNRGIKAVPSENGFSIISDGNSIYIYALDEIRTVYGIYGFLEEYLGCMWLAHDANYIPKLNAARLSPPNKIFEPKMQWRSVYTHEALYFPWHEKLRLNGIGDNKDGERIEFIGWGNWCHTYWDFVPPGEFYADHPEYYAKKGDKVGKIRPGHEALLCLSNPEVYEIVRDRLAKKIEENPQCKYWDFSVMDSWAVQEGCTCPKCREANKREGSGMGTLLPFINKLAREFPDKIISTLAYHNTIRPPKTLKAEKNVAIKLCAMPGSQASSYYEGGTKGSADFKSFLEGWKEICDHIIIWDYVVNFKHLILPFPNFTVQRENQRFYEDNNVQGIFHQGSREENDEMADLRTYLLSRLLWDGSEMNTEKFINRYLAAYYGKAAPLIATYMNRCSRELIKAQKELGIYDFPIQHAHDYLSPENIREYLNIFARAEYRAENEEYLDRVKKTKIPVLYAKMLELSRDIKGKKQAADEFFVLSRKFGFRQLSEWGLSLDEFEKYYYKRLKLSEKIPFYTVTNFKLKIQ